MPRSFELETTSPASADRFLSAFSSQDYWQARLASMEGGALDSFTVDDDGAVSVRTSFRLLSAELPAIVTKLRRGDWELLHSETWAPVDGGGLRGELTLDLRGAPLSGTGSGLLEPVADGSRLTYTATVAVGVPLIGGTIEVLIGNQLTTWLREIQEFTTEWIGENLGERSDGENLGE